MSQITDPPENTPKKTALVTGADRLDKTPSEASQLASVARNGRNIRRFRDPSEAVQLAAVANNPLAVRHIKNPSRSVQMKVVEEDAFFIKCIRNPSEDVQMIAVQKDPSYISGIKDPSESAQLIAVQTDGRVIQYIKKPSEAVQLAAVGEDGAAIQYIKKPSEAVQLAAVRQSCFAIQNIQNPNEAVQMAAVQNALMALEWIRDPSDAVVFWALQKNGAAAIRMIRAERRSESRCLMALQFDAGAAQHFPFCFQPKADDLIGALGKMQIRNPVDPKEIDPNSVGVLKNLVQQLEIGQVLQMAEVAPSLFTVPEMIPTLRDALRAQAESPADGGGWKRNSKHL